MEKSEHPQAIWSAFPRRILCRIESDPNPDNQKLINTLSSEDSQETEYAQERQPDKVVDQQLPAA